jgi:proline utilization trans-activator
MSPALSPEESRMLNPLFDGQPENQSVHARAFSAPDLGFIGEASCAAFSNRLLQCLDDSHTPPSTAGFSNYYRVGSGSEQHVLVDPGRDFPDRMHAKLLLNVARRFIGNYHPLFLEVSFMREIDAVYRGEVTPKALWLCKFYALMCLGEIYTNRRGVEDNRIPGTDYYLRAVNTLPEAYEEPSLLQAEVLTLLVSSVSVHYVLFQMLISSGVVFQHFWSCQNSFLLRGHSYEISDEHWTAQVRSESHDSHTC